MTNDDTLFPIVLATPISADAGKNKAVLVSLQTGTGEKIKALTMALASIADPLFYESLRTEQQLGYVIQCSARSREAVHSIVFLVQSNRPDADAEFLTQRIENFLSQTLAQALVNQQTNVQSYIDGLAANLLQKPQSFGEDVARDWEEVVAETYFWLRRQSLAQAIRKITLSDLENFYRNSIIGPTRRPLLIQVDDFSSSSFLPDDFKQAALQPASAQPRKRLLLRRQMNKLTQKSDLLPTSSYSAFIESLELAPTIVEAEERRAK